MSIFSAIGAVIEKVMTYVPGKVEALKNEKDRLKKERAALIRGNYDEKKGTRVEFIDNRLDAINGLLENHAKD